MQGLQTLTLHSDTQVRHCTARGQWSLYIRTYIICFPAKKGLLARYEVALIVYEIIICMLQ